MLAHAFPLPSYPFENKVSPHIAVLRQEINNWWDTEYEFMSAEVKQKFKRAELGSFTARVASHSDIPPEHLRPFNRWSAWGTVLDDYYDDYTAKAFRPIGNRVIDILNGDKVRPGDNAIFRQIAQTRDEWLAFMPGSWYEEYVEHMFNFVRYGVEEEKPFKKGRCCPSLSLFYVIREHSIAQHGQIFASNGLARQILPPRVYRHPVIKRLSILNARLAAWQNDFFSFAKELKRGEAEPMNLVSVIKQEYKVSIEEAYAEAMRIHNEELEEFIRLQKDLPDFGEDQQLVERYCRHMGEILQGMQSWYLEDTKRYLPDGYANPENIRQQTSS